MNFEYYVWNGPWGLFMLRAMTPVGLYEIMLPSRDTELMAMSYEDVPQAPEETRDILERAIDWIVAWLHAEEPPHEEMPAINRNSTFTDQVWQTLRTIPRGETRTYGEIAEQLGKKNSARSVGRACGQNPLPLWTPCHRIVGADGRMVGFSGGAGVETKRRLLDWEREGNGPAPKDIFEYDRWGLGV